MICKLIKIMITTCLSVKEISYQAPCRRAMVNVCFRMNLLYPFIPTGRYTLVLQYEVCHVLTAILFRILCYCCCGRVAVTWSSKIIYWPTQEFTSLINDGFSSTNLLNDFSYFLDWTKQMKVKKSTVRESTDDKRVKFYHRMMNTIFEDSVEVVPITNFVEGTNKTETMKNIVFFDKMIFKCKSKVIENYCMLGVELGNLKFLFMLIFAKLVAAAAA